MDLRKEFVRRLAARERMVDLCREYGISRKTGRKYALRFKALGDAGLEDLSKAPKVIPHKTPPELEELIVAERRQHPSWGPKKLKAVLEQRFERRFPAASSIGEVLARHGLVQRRTRRKQPPRPTTLTKAAASNDLWCADYKGQFRLGDQTYCYPLTMSDQFSRYILGCEGMPAISDEEAREVCIEIFREHGLPLAIRTDNGVPFASTGLGNLTRLSVLWLRLHIRLERIRPAHPEDNGRHERMHRTLKFETARPARYNLLQQQERFDEFVDEFNNRRPHEALGMKCPSEIFTPSPRRLPTRLPEPQYPTHDDVVRVNSKGQIYLAGLGSVVLTRTLAGEYVGIREERDGRWLVTFVDLNIARVHPDRTVSAISEASDPPEAPTM